MRKALPTLVLAALLLGWMSPPRANFVHFHLSGLSGATVRMIWHPYAGAAGTTIDRQQHNLERMGSVPNRPDSLRRWMDPTSRDTTLGEVPADYVVDMNAGPVVIESVNDDSLDLVARLIGSGMSVSGHGLRFTVTADGHTVRVKGER